jgi:hypothetical protein
MLRMSLEKKPAWHQTGIYNSFLSSALIKLSTTVTSAVILYSSFKVLSFKHSALKFFTIHYSFFTIHYTLFTPPFLLLTTFGGSITDAKQP